MITTSEFLRKAADVLERDGWCQGQVEDPFGRRCAFGALDHVADCFELIDLTLHEAFGLRCSAHRAVEVRCDRGFLSAWNDVQGRTKEEVLALFRNTADELEVGDAAERIANEQMEMVS